MIARDTGDGLLLLRQDDHAHLTRPLAEAWRWPLAEREATALACAIHDDGWSAWDDAPRVDADGRPFTYRNMPPDDYRALWRRGFDRGWNAGAWTGLLVSLHGSRFFEWKKDDPADAAVLAHERARQRDALRELGHADADPEALPVDVARGFTLVRWLDGLSLFLCERWDAPWTADAPGEDGFVKITVARPREDVVTLDPWPFTVDHVDVTAPAKRTPRATWPDDAAFRVDVANAPVEHLTWRLVEPAD